MDLHLQGFTGVTALTGYGFPVLKLLVEFDDGHSATFGNCTDFCYATHIKLLPGELITRLALYDFNYSQNGTVWSAFGGLRLTTAGSAGKRVLNLGYSGVTPWAVGERFAYLPHVLLRASPLCLLSAYICLDDALILAHCVLSGSMRGACMQLTLGKKLRACTYWACKSAAAACALLSLHEDGALRQ